MLDNQRREFIILAGAAGLLLAPKVNRARGQSFGRISTAVRACARYGVLHFEQKCLRTNMEFVQ